MGKSIINHQGVGFILADMAINAEAARNLVWHSAWLKDAGQRNSELTQGSPLTDSLHGFHGQVLRGQGRC
jgi:alkylation response protein AidB-like acyl-CoA dehydrogenase